MMMMMRRSSSGNSRRRGGGGKNGGRCSSSYTATVSSVAQKGQNLLNMSSLRLDANGNIDPVYLEKELQAALDFDLKYKQTDGMKKRAIKTAGSYDEFKNMVACAHLKTVSREEVESLRAVKKGWQKKKDTKPETMVLEREIDSSTSCQAPIAAIKPKKLKKPKTSMDFERDWRRLTGVAEKLSYLEYVGITRSCKILKCDMGAELMEDIILTLIQSGEVPKAAGRMEKETDEEELAPISDPFAWLQAFSEFDRFSLNVRFLSQSTLTQVGEWLCEQCTDEQASVVSARYASSA